MGSILLVCCPIESRADPQDSAPWRARFTPVTPSALDRVRGGFSVGSQLEVSFGIERSFVIGGTTVPGTTLNVMSNGTTSSAASNILQNALDGRNIRSITTLNVTANSLQILKEANLQNAVGDAIAASRIR